jgi:hypothetical protein
MEAMQDALNGEQRIYMEKLSRDRSEIQRSKDQLLEDQKIALASIYESRSQLADERAKLEALQKSFQEQKHRDLLQNTTVKKNFFFIDFLLFFLSLKIEAETRAQQKLVSEQIIRLEKREQELIQREEALILEKRSLTELKQRLDIDQSTIKTQQEEIKQKFIDIEHANELIKKEKERLSQLYFELHALDGKSTGKLQQLQKSIHNLRQQEEHMNEVNNLINLLTKFSIFFFQQYSRMANERENLNHLRSTVPLKKQTPIIDSGFSSKYLLENFLFEKQKSMFFFYSLTINCNDTTFTNEFFSTIN